MRALALFVGCGLAAAPLSAQLNIQPPFTGVYVATDLGSATGVPGPYGGVTFKQGDPSKLLLGGNANNSSGAIYEVTVVRDPQGRVTGFSGTAVQVATAPNIDGGLAYGPNGVLFYTAYPTNTLGQIRPGSSAPDRLIGLGPLGVASSTGTLGFVPNGFPGPGQLKLASYNASTFQGFTLNPDGNGTFDLVPANGPVQISGGPEGILYVPPGSALIPDYQYVLISEYGTGSVVLYQVDGNSNPQPATRLPFLTGLSGAEGACTDPVTGDLFFSTYGGGNRVVQVTGFGVCGSATAYGSGVAGLNGVPSIAGGGCAGRGQAASIDVANGRANAPGLLAIGFQAQNLPVLNGALLVDPVGTFFHLLDGQGRYSLQVFLPIDPRLNGLNLYSQSFYADAAGAFGISATRGLHTLVR